MSVRRSAGVQVERLVTDLGAGETEVLLLGLESSNSILLLDDRLTRSMADSLDLRYTGTLGVLLDAKRAGLVESVKTELDRLQDLRFYVAPGTRGTIIRLAGE